MNTCFPEEDYFKPFNAVYNCTTQSNSAKLDHSNNVNHRTVCIVYIQICIKHKRITKA